MLIAGEIDTLAAMSNYFINVFKDMRGNNLIIFFNDHYEVRTMIYDDLSNSKATEDDQIPTYISSLTTWHIAFLILLIHLCQLVHLQKNEKRLSITIKSVRKEVIGHNYNNYRPTNITSNISKITEKIVYVTMVEFLYRHSIFQLKWDYKEEDHS